jgi:hypothetical protein
LTVDKPRRPSDLCYMACRWEKATCPESAVAFGIASWQAAIKAFLPLTTLAPALGRVESRPARQSGSEIHFAPLGMMWRSLEFRKVRE